MKPGQAYYYDTDGTPVSLEPAGHVAIDLAAAKAAGLPSDVIGELEEHGRPLRSAVVLVESGQLGPDVETSLDEVGALHPVYRAKDDTLLVVLPEVRVETANRRKASEVRRYLRSAAVSAEVVEVKAERLVVRPTTGRGADALELANRLEEDVHPLLAQARFLRVMPRPGVEQPRTKGSASTRSRSAK